MAREEINIAGDEYRPLFRFEPANDRFVVRGRSRLDDPGLFYDRIGKEMYDVVACDPVSHKNFVLELDYQSIKTASAAALRDMLIDLAAKIENDKLDINLAIEWVESSNASNKNAGVLIQNSKPREFGFKRMEKS